KNDAKLRKLFQTTIFNINNFFERPRHVAEKDLIIHKVWGFENEFESNSLEVFISFLRKKLNFIDADFAINSVRGVGYQLGAKKQD
ncbi:MAG: helix-turn-helix domain-containing protein, partial [Clostridia bacterium]|nr:helix-turn-helix domain-containing protein [Clostridia bacterium]